VDLCNQTGDIWSIKIIMKNVIEIERLTHRYGKRIIYEDMNFAVPQGKVVGLLGKNGVGKTTLIKILMGFLRPESGVCRIFGENPHNLSPATRARIGLLFEGHLAYEFMTISQIERFYSAFYPSWNRDIYFDLVDRLKLPYSHKIGNMSCGQRSQVVLGLIFAQNPDLMILDDYSMGLDAGYRRLFLDYLSEYVKDGTKTVFVTSHVIQDMEKIVDEVIFLLRGGEIIQTSLSEFMSDFRQYNFEKNITLEKLETDKIIRNIDTYGKSACVYSFESKEKVLGHIRGKGIDANNIQPVSMTLEDAFIGLTGKY
jgi:ABC-2 type transport system ATP-binding protein